MNCLLTGLQFLVLDEAELSSLAVTMAAARRLLKSLWLSHESLVRDTVPSYVAVANNILYCKKWCVILAEGVHSPLASKSSLRVSTHRCYPR